MPPINPPYPLDPNLSHQTFSFIKFLPSAIKSSTPVFLNKAWSVLIHSFLAHQFMNKL